MLKVRHFEIVKEIGSGGYGHVYLGIDEKTRQKVAIKHLKRDRISHEKEWRRAVKRFEREYRFLSSIHHENVIRSYHFFEENSHFFIVLEYVEGVTLTDFIKKQPSISLKEKLAIAIQICRAVEVFNANGIIHRDLKPTNLIIQEDKKLLKLIDLGIAKNLNTSATVKLTQGLMGTCGYMSPEQFYAKVYKNSDVFSIGVTLYQLFLWTPFSPFAKNSLYDTGTSILKDDLPLISRAKQHVSPNEKKIYKKLDIILSRALQKDHKTRTQSAKELGDSLLSIFESLQNTSQKTVYKNYVKAWQPTPSLKKIRSPRLERIKKQKTQRISRKKLLSKIVNKKISLCGIILSVFLFFWI